MKKTYSTKFQNSILNLVYQNRSINTLSKKYDVPVKTINNWVNKDLSSRSDNTKDVFISSNVNLENSEYNNEKMLKDITKLQSNLKNNKITLIQTQNTIDSIIDKTQGYIDTHLMNDQEMEAYAFPISILSMKKKDKELNTKKGYLMNIQVALDMLNGKHVSIKKAINQLNNE